jgi:hypothetical protein
MVGESGKAMQGTVRQRATAIWEVTRNFEESEAHEFAASLVQVDNAFAAPNVPKP